MSDVPRRASPTGERMAVLEVTVANHIQRFEAHLIESTQLHREARVLAEKMDDRMDRQERLAARFLGALAALGFLGQLLAPVIRDYVQAFVSGAPR